MVASVMIPRVPSEPQTMRSAEGPAPEPLKILAFDASLNSCPAADRIDLQNPVQILHINADGRPVAVANIGLYAATDAGAVAAHFRFGARAEVAVEAVRAGCARIQQYIR
nr:hypothetical protein [Marinobacter sp. es.048]